MIHLHIDIEDTKDKGIKITLHGPPTVDTTHAEVHAAEELMEVVRKFVASKQGIQIGGKGMN